MHVLPIPHLDPLDLLCRVAQLPNVTFLDSSKRDSVTGRYSYVAADPFSTFVVDPQGRAVSDGEVVDADPWTAMRSAVASYRQDTRPDLPPFQGGAAGYIAYDLNRTLESLPEPRGTGLGVPMAVLHFYDVVVAYDHFEDKAWIVSTGWPATDPATRSDRACRRASEVAALFDRQVTPIRDHGPGRWSSNESRSSYEAAVREVVRLIWQVTRFR